MNIRTLFRAAPHRPEIEDKAVVKERYRYWRIRTFYSMYVGYALYYFTRKSFTFAIPEMIDKLGFTRAELGDLGSILALTYGLSKFLSGILADRSNPRYIMAVGLIVTGIFNIFFSLSSTLVFFGLFWGLNGWFQGWGWPPCARLLSHWYSQSERGRWWAAWNTSHNIGGAIIPLIAAGVISALGWRAALYIPGVIAIFGGLFLINRLRDTPRSLGLPIIEKYHNDYPSAMKADEEEKLSTKDILLEFVLKNKYIWFLAFSYFFVYVVRTGMNDWGQLFLIQEKGHTRLAGGSGVSLFEIGGILGSLAAGWASDSIFSGRRGIVNVLFCFGIFISILGLWFMPSGSVLLSSIIMFAIGFFIFGPQMLIGVAAAELSHKKAAGTATGFAGWFAYLGAAAAGGPLGRVTDNYGWVGYFVVVGVCALVATALLIPLWNAKTNKKYEVDES